MILVSRILTLRRSLKICWLFQNIRGRPILLVWHPRLSILSLSWHDAVFRLVFCWHCFICNQLFWFHLQPLLCTYDDKSISSWLAVKCFGFVSWKPSSNFVLIVKAQWHNDTAIVIYDARKIILLFSIFQQFLLIVPLFFVHCFLKNFSPITSQCWFPK